MDQSYNLLSESAIRTDSSYWYKNTLEVMLKDNLSKVNDTGTGRKCLVSCAFCSPVRLVIPGRELVMVHSNIRYLYRNRSWIRCRGTTLQELELLRRIRFCQIFHRTGWNPRNYWSDYFLEGRGGRSMAEVSPLDRAILQRHLFGNWKI